MRRKPATYEDIRENLRAFYLSATPENIEDGRAWYPAMFEKIRGIAADAFDHTGEIVSDALAVGAFAAFSQNATWSANVTMATRYLRGAGRGMSSVLAECHAMEDGADPTDYAVLGLKRADFCANLLGDHERVTCDRWHLRAALNAHLYDPNDLSNAPSQLSRSRVKYSAAKAAKLGRTHSPWFITTELSPTLHEAVTRATRELAAEYGESPAALQAIVWCAVRGTGE